nr:glycosyltransferase [Clostridia bacterium]
MKKLLVMFSNGFPFNISEPFLENEWPLYKEYFDKVLIVSACQRGEKATRNIEEPFIEVLQDYTLSRDVPSILKAIPYTLCDTMFYRELCTLIRKKQFSAQRFYQMCVASLCANHRALLALKWLKKHPGYKAEALYSYWLDIPAYGAVRLSSLLNNKVVRVVSRCHGFDVYSERHNTNYIPFQAQVIERLNHLAPVSVNGAEYLRQKYCSKTKMSVRYLGCSDYGAKNPAVSRCPFHVVSCARVVPVKRLSKIVDALSCIRDRSVVWTHIGDGAGLESLKAYATDKLPPNVHVHFLGSITNEQVYTYYQNTPCHALISVSESEGLPVSMCEAFSFQIPVISTDVGGVSELVDDHVNGLLVHRDFRDEELAAGIRYMIDMPEDAYQQMRKAARIKYEKAFNSEVNTHEFIREVLLMDVKQEREKR